MAGNELIRMENISKYYGRVQALEGVTLRVYENEIVGLLGDNGAGKSTLIKVLSGAVPATSGDIFIRGKKVNIRSTTDAIANGIETVSTVVSSLPLLSLPAEVVNDIVRGVFEALPVGAAMVQFTYGPKPPVPQALRDSLQLQSTRGSRIWRNVPPAVVWTFRKPASK